MTAMRIGRLATVLILCGAWLVAAALLYRTSVPSSLSVHGLAPHVYEACIIAPWAHLSTEALSALVTIAIVLGLAGKLGDRWWLAGAPVFTAIVLAFSFVGGYVAGIGTHRLHDPRLRATVST